MKLSKLVSYFRKNFGSVEDTNKMKTSMKSKTTTISDQSTQNDQSTTSDVSSSTSFNITSYRMHVLETENQYLYEQNRKLNKELKNARSTNDSLKEIIKMKDRLIDSIVEEQYESLQKAHIIEESMRLLLLDGDKQALASKNPKTACNHSDPEALKHFVAAIKSIPSPPQQAKADQTNITMPKSSSIQKHKYTKPLLPPLPAISDSEESFGFSLKEHSTQQTDPYLNLLAVPKNCSRSESVDFGKQLRLMASDF